MVVGVVVVVLDRLSVSDCGLVGVSNLIYIYIYIYIFSSLFFFFFFLLLLLI